MRPIPAGQVMGVPTDLHALAAADLISVPGLARIPLDRLLPPIEGPYIVQVRSYALGDVVQRSRVFYPAALLLDAQHEVLARREPEDLPVVKTKYGDAAKNESKEISSMIEGLRKHLGGTFFNAVFGWLF